MTVDIRWKQRLENLTTAIDFLKKALTAVGNDPENELYKLALIGSFQFSFTSTPGMGFSAYGSTDLSVPFSNWSWLGTLTDNPPGQFWFTDPQVGATNQQRFYRVSSP